MGFILIADINYSLYLLRNCQYFAKQIHLFEKFLQRVLKIFFSNAAAQIFHVVLLSHSQVICRKSPFCFLNSVASFNYTHLFGGHRFAGVFEHYAHIWNSLIFYIHTHTCSVLFLLIRILFSLKILLVYFH